jgi:hypothetical protein
VTQPTHVPIVAYHSIADDHDHLLRQLSLPVAFFERQLQYLDRRGFQTVTLYDVHRYLRDGAPLPSRAIALTFDDGYLDNWVNAFPLLKKYGMKATIFVATDFVDPLPACRPTLTDVWAGTIAARDLDWWGHVSWPELAAMQASGLVDVQAHTQSHAFHFVTDRIVDFHHPEDPYFWLDWHAQPLEKYAWLTRDFRASVPWGAPIYEFEPALLQSRYEADPGVARCAVDHVAERGGRSFFTRPGWRRELDEVVKTYRAHAGAAGRSETGAEYRARVTDDMAGSRRIIADRLNKPVDFLCWPCGDYTPALQRLAIEECGFLATVNVAKTANRPGDAPTELRRIVFGQDYDGLWRHPLIFMNFCGNVNYYSGRARAYPVAPIARRLMRAGRLLTAVASRTPRRPDPKPAGAARTQ